jgi:hypothetical protein
MARFLAGDIVAVQARLVERRGDIRCVGSVTRVRVRRRCERAS